MANIKFFRKDVAPSNPQEGYIWFNSSNNTIQLYKNATWEVYTGKINDVTYADGKLTIVPHVGNSTIIDLSAVANISDLSTRLDTLETSFNTLSGEFETEKGKISTLQGEMTTVKAATATMIGQLAGIEDTVVAHVTAEFEKHNTERESIDADFEDRISTLETGHTTLDGKIDGIQSTLQGAIDTEKGRIDALIGADVPTEGGVQMSVREIVQDEVALQLESENISDSFDTLKEMAEWLSGHPEDVTAMNDAIGKNTTNIATNTADITTIKGDIETINATIEENEYVTASALTDLDERVTALSSSTVSSVSGDGYISATTTDGAVVVTATIGAVANSDNALAIASDVKAYVDNMMTWGEF